MVFYIQHIILDVFSNTIMYYILELTLGLHWVQIRSHIFDVQGPVWARIGIRVALSEQKKQ
jgi:hypothetical protein